MLASESRPIASYGTLESPIGPLLVATSDKGICVVSWLHRQPLQSTLADLSARGFDHVEDAEIVGPIVGQLEEYFAGKRMTFEGALDLRGVSAFTHRALLGIVDIPWGTIATYGDVARSIEMPGATRAVGNAMGMNPIPVIVPCHRVVRSDGSMGNYTGGADIKEALLAIEGVTFGRSDDQLSLPF